MAGSVFHGVDIDEKGHIVAQPVNLNVSYSAFPPQFVQRPAYDAGRLNEMPENHFSDLVERVAKEAARRTSLTKEVKAKLSDYVTAFQNFLLGCAHAMACRAALRWSAGHNPLGKEPASGLPWNAYDGARLSQLVENGEPPVIQDAVFAKSNWRYPRCHSNPLLWKTRGDLEHWLHKDTISKQPAYLS